MANDQTSQYRIAAGLQCHKLLWWSAHEPDASELEPDLVAQILMDEEHRVLEMAREYFPGGYLVDLPLDQVQERVQATRRALAREVPTIFQATFFEDGVVVSVDILARDGRSQTLINVKPSTSMEPHHLWETAIQAYVLRRAGVDVDSVEIMHLNGACRFPETEDLFVREAITGRVRALISRIPEINSDQAAMLEGPLPEVAVGKHCYEPTVCPFKDRCWPTLPADHVETFYGLRQEVSAQMRSQGYSMVDQVPAAFPLTVIQQRQRRSVTEGNLQVEEKLAGALAPLKGRVAHLALRTVSLPIPVWVGLGPWHHYPVGFSCHVVSPGGDLEHHEWLAEGPHDARAAMAEALLRAMEGVDVVVAYDMKSKKKSFEAIAAAVPEQAKAIQAISSKLRDLLPVVRDHVYHPDFHGSFRLETVLPALVPEFSPESLEESEGNSDGALLHRLLFLGEPGEPEERGRLRERLRGSCAAETLGLVRLKDRLDELAGDQA